MEAGAVSVVVDVDPGTAGIQSQATIMNGDSITVDVVVTGVTNLNAFEFDLDFNSTILAATGITSGNFLPAPALNVENNTASPDVNFAEFALVPVGSNGDGVLASITFSSLALGMSDLVLNDVILSAPFGAQILPVTLQNGKITVTNGQQPIPEPGTMVLLATGLGGLLVGRPLMRSNKTPQ